MMKHILQRPLIVYLACFMVAAAGVVSLLMLPIKLQPNATDPTLYIQARAENEMDLAELEKEVTLLLENTALQSDIVKDVTARTDTRNVRLTIALRGAAGEGEINALKEDLQQELNNTSVALDYHQIRQYSTSDNEIMEIAVTSQAADQERVRREWKEVVIPALRKVPGVRDIRHSLDDYKPHYVFELKTDEVRSLEQASMLIEELKNDFSSPLLGVLTYDGKTFRVRSESEVQTADALSEYRLRSGERLSEKVNLLTEREADDYFRIINGQPYYEIDVVASATASEVKISENIRSVMARLYDEKETQWEYEWIWDASRFIGKAIDELIVNILIGALVASLILFVVFRSVRTMVVIAISIPICILTTLLFMRIFGYSINIITLMGIGLGTGMIVDACIVVIENIFRKLQQTENRKLAIMEGTTEVIGPIISSILTTIAVFVPIAFLDGVVGQFLRQLALTVTVALLASLAVALTLIPNLSYRLVKPKEDSDRHQRILQWYEKGLRFVLRRKWRTLLLFVAMCLLSLYVLIAYVPKNYIPNVSDRSFFAAYEVEENVGFETNRMLMEETAAKMKQIDGVDQVLIIGDKDQSHRGYFIVLYKPLKEMTRSDEAVRSDLEKLLEQEIPYTYLSVGAGQGDTSGQLEVSLTSTSMQRIISAVPSIEEAILLIDGVTGVESSSDMEETKEWVIDFSKSQLRHYNMTRKEVEDYVRLVLNGVEEIDLHINGEETQASVRFPDHLRETSDALYQLPVRETLHVTLDDLAELKQVSSESFRSRKDGKYETSLTVHYDRKKKEPVLRQVEALMENSGAFGVDMAFAGQQQEQNEAFRKLLIAVGVAFASVFTILTVQFNRLRQPFFIMLSLPFAMIGVTLGFLITGRVFDIMAMIGIIILVGIVVNNAIVLIDFINRHRKHYTDTLTAVVEGAKLRVRPILTTTFTTVGGLIPLAIGGSHTSDFQTPIATAVIFGLLFSTLVSLMVVPCLYLLLDGGKKTADKKSGVEI